MCPARARSGALRRDPVSWASILGAWVEGYVPQGRITLRTCPYVYMRTRRIKNAVRGAHAGVPYTLVSGIK